MIDIYKEIFPNRGMNHQILKSSLCERGLSWDKEIRCPDGIKGCYINVVRKIENLENIEDDNNYKFGKSPFDYGLKTNDSELEEENTQLKLKIKELEAQLLQLQSPKKEEIKQVPKIEKIIDDDIEALEKELNDACNMVKLKENQNQNQNQKIILIPMI